MSQSKPEDSICMIELDEKGENYRIVWGLVNGGCPTSELPSHLMNLEVKKLQDERYRVVYHAHTTNVIALTFVLPLEDKVFIPRTLGDGQPSVLLYSRPESVSFRGWFREAERLRLPRAS